MKEFMAKYRSWVDRILHGRRFRRYCSCCTHKRTDNLKASPEYKIKIFHQSSVGQSSVDQPSFDKTSYNRIMSHGCRGNLMYSAIGKTNNIGHVENIFMSRI